MVEEEESKVLGCVRVKGDKLYMDVSVRPGSKKYTVTKVDAESIGLAVKGAAREGAANEDVVAFVAEVVGVKRRQVGVVAGAKSR